MAGRQRVSDASDDVSSGEDDDMVLEIFDAKKVRYRTALVGNKNWNKSNSTRTGGVSLEVRVCSAADPSHFHVRLTI